MTETHPLAENERAEQVDEAWIGCTSGMLLRVSALQARIHTDHGAAQATARARIVCRGQHLQWLTIGWNSAECFIAVVAGLLSGSIALVGFGLDSAIEVASSLAAVWRLRRDAQECAREAAELITMRVIGTCFVLLAAWITWDGVTALLRREAPNQSPAGIVLAALSLIVMPLLASLKRRVASQLQSGALAAESRQTEICAYLSAILLAGLGLNAWLGWWWADPVAGLVMVPLIAKEGWEALRGRTCCPD